jgi:hypothetical protein
MSEATRSMWTRQAADGELRDLLVETRDRWDVRPAWMFVEGPTRCQFAYASALDLCRLGTAWQVRLFCRSYELAARRRDFEQERPWLVRYVGEAAPADVASRDDSSHDSPLVDGEEAGGRADNDDGAWCPDSHELTDGSSFELRLFEKPTGEGRTSDATRFATAELDYPVPELPLQPVGQAKLIVRSFDHDGGPIICWSELKPKTTSGEP